MPTISPLRCDRRCVSMRGTDPDHDVSQSHWAPGTHTQLLEQFVEDVASLRRSTPGVEERVVAFLKDVIFAIHLLDGICR